MKYEYKQVKYRVDKGKFDGSLNRRVEQGWKIESLDRIENLFLVTYSRPIEQKLEHVHCEVKDLERILARRTQDRLVAFASESGWANLVWRWAPGRARKLPGAASPAERSPLVTGPGTEDRIRSAHLVHQLEVAI